MPCRGRGGCAVAAPMHALMPCTMRGQDRVALSPSAYKYRGSAEGKKKKRRRRGAGTFSFERESEGDRERDRQLLERKRGETEGVKHHERARDRK